MSPFVGYANKLMFAAMAAVLTASCAYGQVRYVDHVPSVAQARAALGLPDPSSVQTTPTGSRRKGIAWIPVAHSAPAPAHARGLAMPVNFDHGATGVSRASLAYLAVVATVLADDASLHLVIEGHTDASGDPRTNAMLSWERAFAVFRVLVHRYGIDPQRLQPVGLGSIDPLRPSEPGHAMNRRVQFRIAS